VAQTLDSTARDFDRIARLPDNPWDHNRLYHWVLLRELPPFACDALEIGCGAGELTAKLAARVSRVVAVDLSPEMLGAAKARCAELSNIELLLADASTLALARESFDVIASIATLHHLPLAATFARARDALRPGGVLLVLDVVDERTPFGVARALAALPLSVLGRLATTGRLRPPPELRAARGRPTQPRTASRRSPRCGGSRRRFCRVRASASTSSGATHSFGGSSSCPTCLRRTIAVGTSSSHIAPSSGSTISIATSGQGGRMGSQSRLYQ
jgi:SAM-dependent methyltransferase